MPLSTDTRDQVRQATDIVDLIGSYLPLRRSGSNFVCHCPWHDDHRPSLQVNPARQSWVCWVCDIRGDVFDFVMRKEGVEFFESLQILAQRAGIPITAHQKKVVKGSVNDKQTLFAAMRWAVERFHDYLLDSDHALAARDYLQQRGFGDDAINTFSIGFAPLKWSWLADQARNTEFTPEILAACDLIANSERGSGYFERFRGRLIFPIFDVMGRPIAMGGRLVPGVELESQSKYVQAKYVNSRETRLFSKSETLYGLNFVKDQVAKSRSLTVVEGYTDVIGAWQAGLQDVVACLGTALNDKHIRLIKRFADRINLVLDGDEAGKRRANEVVDLFVANDVDLRILTLPDGHDPLEFIEANGADALRELAKNAADALGHKIRIETAGIDLLHDTHRANAALENILSTLAKVPTSLFSGSSDKILRQDQLLARLARQFSVDTGRLKSRLSELRIKLARSKDSAPERASDWSNLPKHESELIQIILGNPDCLDTVIEKIGPDQFEYGPLKILYQQIDDCFQNGEEVSFDSLKLVVEQPEQKNLLGYLNDQWHDKRQQKSDGLISIRQMLADTLKVFTNRELNSGNQKVISQLMNNQLNEEEELDALEELLNQTRQQQGI